MYYNMEEMVQTVDSTRAFVTTQVGLEENSSNLGNNQSMVESEEANDHNAYNDTSSQVHLGQIGDTSNNEDFQFLLET
jgi:hypothetical protein